jgi:hypothetical protein
VNCQKIFLKTSFFPPKATTNNDLFVEIGIWKKVLRKEQTSIENKTKFISTDVNLTY